MRWRAAVEALAAKGVRATGRALDVADGPALTAWVADVADEFGGIDKVVANVSALAIGPEDENWEQGFRVDIMGAVRLVNAAMEHLVAVGRGVDRDHLQRVGPRDRLRLRSVRRVQGRTGPLHAGPRLPPGRPGHSSQLGITRQHLLRRRGLEPDRDRRPGAVRMRPSPSTPPVAWAHHRRWPTPPSSCRAIGPASSPAPTSSSTAP